MLLKDLCSEKNASRWMLCAMGLIPMCLNKSMYKLVKSLATLSLPERSIGFKSKNTFVFYGSLAIILTNVLRVQCFPLPVFPRHIFLTCRHNYGSIFYTISCILQFSFSSGNILVHYNNGYRIWKSFKHYSFGMKGESEEKLSLYEYLFQQQC